MPKTRLAGLLILILSFAATAAATRDFAAHPAIVELDTKSDVYAIGDTHGDFKALTSALAGAKLIESAGDKPDNLKWTGGDNVLVCTGDILDKGTDALDCIAALRHLQQTGHVIVTMGNHEAEFLADKGKKKKNKKAVTETVKGKKFTDELERSHIDVDAVRGATDSGGIGAWLRDLPIGARVNDSFFSHAGNSHAMTIPALKDAIGSEVSEQGFGAPILQDPDSILQARMHPHPWWEAEEGDVLKRNLKALGVSRIVFGHQPSEVTFAGGMHRVKDAMFADPAGRFVMIDIGMSQGQDGTPPALLRIHQNGDGAAELFEISADGKSTKLSK